MNRTMKKNWKKTINSDQKWVNTNFGFFFSPSLPLLSIITITFIFCFYTKFRLRQLLLLLWLNLDFFFLCSTLVQILLVVFYDGWHFHKFLFCFVLYYFMQKTNDDWKGKKGSLYHIIIIKWNQIPFSLKTIDCLSSLMMMVSIRFLFDFFSYSSFDIIIIFFFVVIDLIWKWIILSTYMQIMIFSLDVDFNILRDGGGGGGDLYQT